MAVKFEDANCDYDIEDTVDLTVGTSVADQDAAKANTGTDFECILCFARTPQLVILVPCGHMIFCRECNEQYKARTCPLCRQLIGSRHTVSL